MTSFYNLALPLFEIFVLISLDVNLSLNQILLVFWLYLRQTWKTQLISQQFLYEGLSLFSLKGFSHSYAWSWSFARKVSLENLRILIYVFDWLYFIRCLTFPLAIAISVFCTVFDAISSNEDEFLLTIPSAN